MAKHQKKSQRTPPKSQTASTYDSPGSDEIAKITKAGAEFADRVGNELAAYAVEAETRRNAVASSSGEVESILAGNPPKQIDPERIERVNLDPFAEEKARLNLATATLECEATQHAAALILQTEVKA